MNEYDPQTIEAKWQKVWDDEGVFHTPDPTPGNAPEKHWYQLEMLPYPSAKELHMGHVLNYTMGDVVTWFRRRNGWTVLRPMGWDAFGLPAENAAIREGGHPRETTEQSIVTMRAQMQRLGWAIDWDREVSAHRPDFYRWTQWLFLRFFEKGLAYRKEGPVNWCPKDQTVVANEYVVDGICERCGTPVELRNLTQWFMKVTAYADELLEYELPEGGWWPERTKTIQRNWIGRSEGAAILFRADELDIDIEVFTTRPDTLFGATFFVVAPEHSFVEAHANEEAQAYARHAGARRAEERAADQAKTGVFTGHHVTNPATGEQLPIYVADYVLMDYGTGAIMAVPGHDERDREFAEAFDLPIVEVIDEDGRMVNSGEFDGLEAEEGKARIVAWLRELGRGAPAVSFRLRDWSFSRQRYWGCPIPIVYCDDCGIVPVPDEELPVVLPEVENYLPKGKAPLATNEEWMNVPCPRCGKPARREADTMDTFVDSSWYYLRYVDPHNDQAPFDRALVDYWLPINQYIGGIDHSTGHLLYSRFFVKAMNDMGLVGFREPFARVFHQGWVTLGGTKMSKTRGNVAGPVRPDRRSRGGRRPAVHPVPGARRPGHGVDAVRDRGHLAVPAPAVARRARGCGDVGGGRSRRRRTDAKGARDHREGHGRRRPALPVPHADLGGQGAGQRARGRSRRARCAVRRRDRRLADPAVRAAHRRRAVGRAGARAAVGGAVAVV